MANVVRVRTLRSSIGPVSPQPAEVSTAPSFAAWAGALLAQRGFTLGDDAPLVELLYLGADQLLAPLSVIDVERMPFGDLDFRRAPDNS